MDLFLDELSAVKSALGVKRHHILGHGWGGMLALTALSRGVPEEKQAVASLSLASVPPSYRQLIQDRQRRVREVLDTLWHSSDIIIAVKVHQSVLVYHAK